MYRMRKSQLSRWVALFLVITFTFSTTLLPPWGMRSVEAQSAQPPRALIFDFVVEEGVESVLGRRAADAFAVELSAAQRYSVVSRSAVEDALRNVSENVLPPHKATQLRVATMPTVRASSVFLGRILRVEVNDKPLRAQVALEVMERDVVTGEFVNGVRVTESSLPKLGRIRSETLILEALNRAARSAVEELQTRRPLQGSVAQIAAADAVVLNIGLHQGVEIGQHFAVVRGEGAPHYVGRAEVTQVGLDQSVARVAPVAGSESVKMGDRVRQIYAQVATPPDRPGRAPSDGGTGGGGGGPGAGGLVVGGLLVALLLGGISKSSKGGVAAAAPGSVSARAGSTGNNVLVRWSLPGAVSDLDIVGHFIHRSTFPGFAPSVTNVIDFVPGAQARYLDQPGDYSNQVQIQLQTQGGGGGGGGAISAQVQQQIQFLTGGTIPPPTGNLPPPGSRDQSITVTAVHLTPAVGVQHFYSVTRIIIVPPGLIPPGTGTGGGGGQAQQAALATSRPSTVSGGTTPLAPPILVSPTAGSADVALQNVTFEWLPAEGADAYQIQLSVDPFFPVNNRFASRLIRDTRQGVTLSQTFNNLIVPNAALNTPIFWRVGARNSRDALDPTGEGISTPNDNGFVWSQAQTFTLREQPPAPPQQQRVLGGDDHTRTGRMERRRRRDDVATSRSHTPRRGAHRDRRPRGSEVR